VAVRQTDGRHLAQGGADGAEESPEATSLEAYPLVTDKPSQRDRRQPRLNGRKAILRAARVRDHLRQQWEQLCRIEEKVHNFSAMRLAQQASQRRGVLLQALDEAIAMTGADMGNIQCFDPSAGALKIEVQRGFSDPFLVFFDEVREAEAACGAAFESARTVVVEDVAESPIFLGSPALEVMLDAQARAVLSIPLAASSGRILGILSTHFRRPGPFHEAELRRVEALAQALAGWLEHNS
jgi:hypothetical protein